MPLTQRRSLSLALVLSVILSSLAVLVPTFTKPADAAARTKPSKFEVCHRTSALNNPYRRIRVAWSAVNADESGHDNSSHDGPVFDVSSPFATHGRGPRDSGLGGFAGGGNDRWGDIFNVSRSTGPSNDRQNSNNWTPAGEAIFKGATFTYNGVTKQACRTISATDYLRSELDALLDIRANTPVGQPTLTDAEIMTTVVSGLDDMAADEDILIKQDLPGGSFSGWLTNCRSGGGCATTSSFTTALAAIPQPSVTTESPSNINTSNRSATLNGTITPAGESMTWYFEVSPTNDFTEANTSIFEVTPASGSPSSASGTTRVSVSATNLTSSTRYYYRTVGLVTTTEAVYLYGEVKEIDFSRPVVNTTAATSVTGTTATINGTGTTNGANSTVSFLWGTTSDLTGGTNAQAASPTLTHPATAEPFSLNLTGLAPGTTYYFQALITNTNGSAEGVILNFSTPGPPTVTTEPATSVTGTTATINGTGTTNGSNRDVTFKWGTTSDLTAVTPVQASSPTLTDPATAAPFSLNLTGLTPGTTYFFQASISNGSGTVDGSTLQFTTPSVPTVTTEPATSVTGTTATINGTGTTNGANSTVTFTWGTRSDLTGGDTLTGQAATPGTLTDPATGSAFSRNLTNLTPGTTYYFRATISNTNGTVNGSILQFTTDTPSNQNQVTPPAVTTEPATSVTGTTATINGTGTSNGATSTVTFTWGTSPTLATGNTTINATPSSLDGNASGTAVSAALTGLTPGTTYYFRTSITNANGSADGIIREFTTPLTSSASNDPLGRVIGTAWFDIDRDNRRDSDEPLLPGVDVQLTPTSVTGQSAGTVRKKNYVMKTDSAGAFDFSQLPPGTYRITSLLPGDFGIQESWDSTGNNDWQVTVTVVALQTSRGDFAAIAPVEATGTVDGGGGGTLDATWTGFDQKNDTNDDVTFTVKLSANGSYTLQGLPTGKYAVKATSKAGRTLVSSNSLRITNKDATLTLNGITMKVKIVAFLPATGATNMLTLFGFAAMLIPAGIAATATTRSRRRRRLN